MTDDERDRDRDDQGEDGVDPIDVDAEEDGVPDSDPRHLDPAGDLAELVESGDVPIQLADDQDADELREFLDAVERGDVPRDPGTEATVRIVRALLDDHDVDE